MSLREEVLQWFENRIFRTEKDRQQVEREAAKRWHIRARQSRNYVAEVRRRWRESRAANADETRDELDGLQRVIIGKAMRDHDWGAATRGVRNLADLHGAMSPTEMSVTLTQGLAAVSPSQERLEELRRKQEQKQLEAAPALQLVEKTEEPA